MLHVNPSVDERCTVSQERCEVLHCVVNTLAVNV